MPINVAPETFTVHDGLIVSTGKPTGMLRTDRPYENFIIELEWRHMKPGGNAGLFVWGDSLPAVGLPFSRGVEVQILDGHETPNSTSQGDVFAIQGATMKPDRPHPAGWMRSLPSEKRAKPSPEWNHYRVTCRDGTIKLAVNGKEVSGGTQCIPRKGFICLESEGSECHFRNIRIQELPTSNPPASETAMLDDGFVSLYSGLDLRGWKMIPGHEGHWTAHDHILEYDGKSDGQEQGPLDREGLRRLRDGCRLEAAGQTRATRPRGDPAQRRRRDQPRRYEEGLSIPYAGDSGILPRGSTKAQVNITCNTVGSGELYGYRTDKKMPAEVRSGSIPKSKADKAPGQWNRFLITMQGDRISVVLNGQTVIDKTQLPGISTRGPIGLQHHGDPVQFTNLFIKELS